MLGNTVKSSQTKGTNFSIVHNNTNSYNIIYPKKPISISASSFSSRFFAKSIASADKFYNSIPLASSFLDLSFDNSPIPSTTHPLFSKYLCNNKKIRITCRKTSHHNSPLNTNSTKHPSTETLNLVNNKAANVTPLVKLQSATSNLRNFFPEASSLLKQKFFLKTKHCKKLDNLKNQGGTEEEMVKCAINILLYEDKGWSKKDLNTINVRHGGVLDRIRLGTNKLNVSPEIDSSIRNVVMLSDMYHLSVELDNSNNKRYTLVSDLELNINDFSYGFPLHQTEFPEINWILFINSLINSYDLTHSSNSFNKKKHLITNSTSSDFLNLEMENYQGQVKSIHMNRFQTPRINIAISSAKIQKILRDIDCSNKLSIHWPFKPGTASSSKCNLFLDDLLESLKNEDILYFRSIRKSLPQLQGLFHDQIVLLILNHYLLHCQGHLFDFLKYACLVFDEDIFPKISDLSKQLGLIQNLYLNPYIEGDCIYGRGSKPLNMKSEVEETCSLPAPDGQNVQFKKGEIYSECLKVFSKCMPKLNMIDPTVRHLAIDLDIEKYFHNRTINCVNGAHHLPLTSNLIDIKNKDFKSRLPWLESISENFLFKTKPIISATLSIKHDLPKDRPIKSQDTVSYCHEDFLYRIVEKYWSSDQILLEPSLSTKAMEADRIDKMAGKERLMLDFSKMDKQHSLLSQKEVTTALVDFLNLSEDMKKYYIDLEENQFLQFEGSEIKTKFGLLTGRRSTTFKNVVLNFVYLKLALQEDFSLITQSIHAGDDTIFSCTNRDDCKKILTRALNSKNSFHPRKISVGPTGEFLRHSVQGNISSGYVNRSLGSFVSGSWVNEAKLSDGDILNTYYRYCWTIDNRARIENYFQKCCQYSLMRFCNLSYDTVKNILTHKASVNGGPIHSAEIVAKIYKPKIDLKVEPLPDDLPNFGSQDYLNNQAKVLTQVITSKEMEILKRVLKLTSYRRGLKTTFDRVDLKTRTGVIDHTIINAQYSWAEKHVTGILSGHVLLSSIKNIVSQYDFGVLAKLLSDKSYDQSCPFEEWLWGSPTSCLNTTVTNNFDDLCQISQYQFYYKHLYLPTFRFPRFCMY